MFIFKYIFSRILAFDYFTLLIICGLAAFGITIIGGIAPTPDHPLYYLQARQLQMFASGLFLFFMFSMIDYKFLLNFYWFIYGGMLLLLIGIMLFGTAMDSGVTRGIQIGPMTLQPSQFSKIFMVLFLSKFIDKNEEKINNIIVLLYTFVLIIIPVYLVFRQPSLSASMVILSISITLVYLGGLSYKYIFTSISALIPTLVLIFLDVRRGPGNYLVVDRIIGQFQIDRLYLSMQAEPHPQNMQALLALGSGQLHGQGLGQGIVNQLNTLPESHNDFILAIIGEEFGFIGVNILLLVYLIFIIRCIIIASNADTNAGRLAASGIASIIFFQVFVHIGVVTNFLPNTGIALPFISSGGSSMWTLMIAMGILNSIYIESRKPKSFFKED